MVCYHSANNVAEISNITYIQCVIILNLYQAISPSLKALIFLSFFFLGFCNSLYANDAITHNSPSQKDIKIEKINQAIQNKLDYYNQTFPYIQFVHLKNGEWEKSLQALELFIGYQATSLDYEHPKELREDLLYVTVAKIQMMLVKKITSSYLFKVGEMPVASKKHTCVITLDAATNVLTNQIATQYFIDLPLETLNTLPEKSYLNKEQQLDFIIDHEAFHCLDSFHYGGIPMSMKEYSTRYDCFKREIQADMFAIAMHMRRNKKLTHFANNIMTLRAMTLLNGELQHDSSSAMQLMINTDKENFIHTQPMELVKKVKQLYKTIAPNYEEYLDFRVAAIEVISLLGKQVNEYEKPFSPTGRQPDKEIMQRLMKQSLDNFQKFTGKVYTLPSRK